MSTDQMPVKTEPVDKTPEDREKRKQTNISILRGLKRFKKESLADRADKEFASLLAWNLKQDIYYVIAPDELAALATVVDNIKKRGADIQEQIQLRNEAWEKIEKEKAEKKADAKKKQEM